MSAVLPDLKPGRYRHYKGKDYAVIRLARHSETEEWVVVYRTLYGDFSWWVRPFEMFTGSVMQEGQEVSRFRYIGPLEADAVPADLR